MNHRPKKVLVVDDDQTVVAFVRGALDSENYEVMGVADGPTGLTRACQEHPDLIILDVYLPRQPGFYTLRDLKTDPKTKNIPVIMLTGVSRRLGINFSTQDLYDFLGIEPDVYLKKPVDPIYLRGVIERLLNGPSTPRKVQQPDKD